MALLKREALKVYQRALLFRVCPHAHKIPPDEYQAIIATLPPDFEAVSFQEWSDNLGLKLIEMTEEEMAEQNQLALSKLAPATAPG